MWRVACALEAGYALQRVLAEGVCSSPLRRVSMQLLPIQSRRRHSQYAVGAAVRTSTALFGGLLRAPEASPIPRCVFGARKAGADFRATSPWTSGGSLIPPPGRERPRALTPRPAAHIPDVRPTLAGAQSHVAHHRPNSGEVEPDPVEITPNLAWTNLRQSRGLAFVPKGLLDSTELGRARPTSARQIQGEFGQRWPNCSHAWADIDRIWPWSSIIFRLSGQGGPQLRK